MKSTNAWLLALLAVAAAGAGGYWIGHQHAGTGAIDSKSEEPTGGSKEEPKPAPTVQVSPIRRAAISEALIAYGTVVAPPNEVRVVSVPYEARVTRTLVSPGQTVSAGQPLVEVEGSAATVLAGEEARNAAAAAEKDLQIVQQRYEQHLATEAERQTATNALRTAQARLQSLQQAGAGGPLSLKSNAPGVVSKVDVQIGQVVPVGGPLVEVAARNQIEVKLGVEPSDVQYLKVDQPVQLQPVDSAAGAMVEGKVRVIGERVDPMSRLVDVMVALPPDARLLLEMFIVGRATRASADDALLVPREAVAPGDESGRFELFTVKDGKAVKHTVRLGIQGAQDVQVIGDDLKEGEPAVVVGNYQLEDGMEVRALPAPAKDPASRPAGDDEETVSAHGATSNPTALNAMTQTTSPSTGPAHAAEDRP